jgi:predicted PurR-regulated permease PerM
VPQPAAIFAFFFAVGAIIVLFFWAAVPPALHQIQDALDQHVENGESVRDSTGIRHDVLVSVEQCLHRVPSGHELVHPIASYGHQATHVIVATFFTLAATWYWVSERDGMIGLLTSLAPEAKREKARRTSLTIDARLARTPG